MRVLVMEPPGVTRSPLRRAASVRALWPWFAGRDIERLEPPRLPDVGRDPRLGGRQEEEHAVRLDETDRPVARRARVVRVGGAGIEVAGVDPLRDQELDGHAIGCAPDRL